MKTADISVEYIQHTGSDLSVVNAARVSFDKESAWEKNGKFGGTDQDLSERDAKLIRYLASHKHTSPFNHSYITLRIKAPVFVARQMVKHKFMPWNEVSRRYVDDEPEFYFPDVWRAKAENVKQGSSDDGVDLDEEFNPHDDIFPEWATESALKSYQGLLSAGVCAEQARMILPQNMMTSWWWSGTLGAYCDMLRLRLDPHTQKESRIVAEKVKEIIEPLFPVSVPALLAIN